MSKINYVEKYSKKTQKFRAGGMMGMNYPGSKGPMMNEQMMAKGGMMNTYGGMSTPMDMKKKMMMESGGMMEGMSDMMGKKYVAGMAKGGMMDKNMMAGGGMMDRKMMYQEGGEMMAEVGAEMGDVMAAIEQVYQSQDPQMALQIVNALYEMQMGGAEQAAAVEGGAAAGPEPGAPMARNGIKTSPVFKASIKG